MSKFLAQQAQFLLEDKSPNTIKIGLVVNEKQLMFIIQLIAQLCEKLSELSVVFYPVGFASFGGQLT